MKSLKIKKITIKDSKLRNLRKGLRQVIDLAVHDKHVYYTQLEKLYNEKWDKRGKLTPSQLKRIRELSRLKNKLHDDLRKSMCFCAFACCLSEAYSEVTDIDMVWIPWYQGWYCVPCFEEYFKDMTIDDYIHELNYYDEDIGPPSRYVREQAAKYRHSFLKKPEPREYRPTIDNFKPWLKKPWLKKIIKE